MFHRHGFLVFYKVPFVYQNNNALIVPFCQMKYIKVLSVKTNSGVDHNNTDVTVFNSSNGSHNRVELKIFMNLSFLSKSCSIYKCKFMTKLIIVSVNRITCSSCNAGHDVLVFSHQGIN